MSGRVTRSTARQSAANPNANPNANSADTSASPTATRKRKAPGEPSPVQPQEPTETPPPRGGRRTKRTRVETQAPPPAAAAPKSAKKGKAKSAMATPAPPAEPLEELPVPSAQPSSSRRGKQGRKAGSSGQSTAPADTASTSRLGSRKSISKPEDEEGSMDISMDDASEHNEDEDRPTTGGDHDHGDMSENDDDEEEEHLHHYDEEDDDDDDDPFSSPFLGRRPGDFSSTLRAISGFMSGFTNQLRRILEGLKSSDQSEQLSSLQEFSQILLVSTEDNLAGHFSPDPYVKELVRLMQPSDFGDENPEIMIVACRCIANMMEALPSSTANVVYGGAVPVLCSKLLEINFIDLAEQALSTLEKISVEFPGSIVREGGLTACLTYLDFFPTSTQRSAVTTAANCCKNLQLESFPTVRDVMHILGNILNNTDQKVVEQGCLCVHGIVKSFSNHHSKLEELVSPDLLRTMLRLLLPGTTNLIGANIHTKFLTALSFVARASPRLSVELLKMNVVDTLYQILTGVSPPSDSENVGTKIDSVIVMQSLIHRPKDQVYETLNVICELLPEVTEDGLSFMKSVNQFLVDSRPLPDSRSRDPARKVSNDKRIELLKGCEDEVRRFAVIIFPTLTDAYSSTVNLNVRQKVLMAQLKMLSNLEVPILEDALRPVPYASFLGSILSQQDHHTLVKFALQAAELLLKRMDSIYRYQFYREGVIAEITALANRSYKVLGLRPKEHTATEVVPATASSSDASSVGDVDGDRDDEDMGGMDGESEDEEDEAIDHDDDHDDDGGDNHDEDDDSDSSSSSGRFDHRRDQPPQAAPDMDDEVTLFAKRFLETHEKDSTKPIREKAGSILEDLKSLAQDITQCFLKNRGRNGVELFTRLAAYFDGDALETITSYELKSSGIVDVFLEVFSESATSEASDGESAFPTFLEAFMGSSVKAKINALGSSAATPFSVLVCKLQDLLSREEHFEVITVHQQSYDSSKSSATALLAKQLRLKLVADEDSGIPKAYRNIMVSIHAIATFKSLDDYLRPRISLADRPRATRAREAIASYAADLAAGRTPGLPPVHPPSESTNRPTSKKSSKSKPADSPGSARPGSSSNTAEKASSSRRSNTKQQTQVPVPPPPPPPPPALSRRDTDQEPVECADEERLSDPDSLDENEALGAIVDELEDEMDAADDDEGPDPSAVNVEVAATGKVTARKDDGTRVATPVQGRSTATVPSSAERPPSSSQRLAELLRQHGGSPLQQALRSSAGALSYAAALQAIPQDWHIEFSVNDQPLANDTTIYRAVHFSQSQPPEIAHRTVWGATHTIKFKRVSGPPSSELSSASPPPESPLSPTSGLPSSLNKNPVTSAILRLLSILHGLNSNIDDVFSDNRDMVRLHVEPLSQFVNTKLTAKLNRQLEEPLIVASNCLPSWSEDLARYYPFLFPFETRHLFLQSTSFGYSRSMARWQTSQSGTDSRNDRHRDDRPFLGRLQRQKVRISRTRILESAVKVMELYGSSPSILEVEYFEEVGTGLGPTLEFYATVSKEFAKKKLKLWRENESGAGEYAFGTRGLFPAPISAEQAESENGKKVLHLFKILGKFVARAMLDSRIIDISFNPTFFRIGDGSQAITPSLGALSTVDNGLAGSLKLLKKFANEKKRIDEDGSLTPTQKVQAIQDIMIDDSRVEDLGLDFTLPGYDSIELVENGGAKSVTIDNVDLYLDKVLDCTLGSGVRHQVNAFRAGFSQVFPYTALRAFTPDELVMLFGQVDEDWSLETLMDSIKADHGYNMDSRSVRNLLQVMSEFTPEQRRDFLQFITGSPKLPIGGFKSLTPMFTVVCKPSEPPFTSDDYLPSVMTCQNYLKMPDYTTIDILKEKLNIAISDGQGAFHLS